VVAISI